MATISAGNAVTMMPLMVSLRARQKIIAQPFFGAKRLFTDEMLRQLGPSARPAPSWYWLVFADAMHRGAEAWRRERCLG